MYVHAFACVDVLCVCARINMIHKQHVMMHGYVCVCAGECVRETRRENMLFCECACARFIHTYMQCPIYIHVHINHNI